MNWELITGGGDKPSKRSVCVGGHRHHTSFHSIPGTGGESRDCAKGREDLGYCSSVLMVCSFILVGF
jgi:hypothetical protein